VFFPNFVFGFFDNANLERTEKKISVEVVKDSMYVELAEKIKNPTTEIQQVIFSEPLPLSAENINFFVESEGKNFEILQTDEDRLPFLFEQAQKNQDVTFFRFVSDNFKKYFYSSEILEIGPQQEISAKIIFDAKLEFVNNFFFTEIFNNDEKISQKFSFDLSILTEEPIKHFFSNLPTGGLIDRKSTQIAFLFEKENFLSKNNIQFFWSHLDTPVLSFSMKDQTYFGHFLPHPNLRQLEEIIFLVDRSGSMSGHLWDRTKEFLNFILEKLPDEQKVKIAFFDTELVLYDENFLENTFDFRKKFFEKLIKIDPFGETNFEKILALANANFLTPFHKRALIILTDSEKQIDQKKFISPTIVLNFSDKKNNPLNISAENSGGFFVKLFPTASSVIEAEEFLTKWQNWRYGFLAKNVGKMEGENEILPNIFSKIFTSDLLFFVGRKNDPFPNFYSKHAKFLPRVWGSRRIAEILKNKNYSLDLCDALLAIGRTFGIKTKFFDEKTNSLDLEKILKKASNAEIQKEIFILENPNLFNPESNAKFKDEIPFFCEKREYENYCIWRQFNFFERVRDDVLIKIAPFSEAQKKLFLKYSKILAPGFGVSDEVDFCTDFRCVSIRKNFRAQPKLSDRAFFRDFDEKYWANPYLIKLIDKGILNTELNGKLYPDRAIDRGHFVNMAFLYFFPNQKISTQISSFSDVEKNSPFYKGITFFHNKKIISGYTDGTFRPLQSITRAEAIKILLSIKNFIPTEEEKNAEPIFSDAASWEKPWVNHAKKIGLIQGFDDCTFRPHEDLTKAQAAKLILLTK